MKLLAAIPPLLFFAILLLPPSSVHGKQFNLNHAKEATRELSRKLGTIFSDVSGYQHFQLGFQDAFQYGKLVIKTTNVSHVSQTFRYGFVVFYSKINNFLLS